MTEITTVGVNLAKEVVVVCALGDRCSVDHQQGRVERCSPISPLDQHRTHNHHPQGRQQTFRSTLDLAIMGDSEEIC